MEAIILAGGLGTRLRSRLSSLPKVMAPIAGRPFLAILLDQLVDQGCSRIILSVGYLGHLICNAFSNPHRGVPIDYVVEESPLGTGGAIRLALSHARERSVLVLNGDTYLDADFAAMLSLHGSVGSTMTMAVTRVQEMSRYGGVVLDEGYIAGFLEKGRTGPGWINAGVYVLASTFLWPEGLPSRFSFETDLLAPFLSRLRPAAFLCRGHFLDIGTPEDFDRAQNELPASRQDVADEQTPG